MTLDETMRRTNLFDGMLDAKSRRHLAKGLDLDPVVYHDQQMCEGFPLVAILIAAWLCRENVAMAEAIEALGRLQPVLLEHGSCLADENLQRCLEEFYVCVTDNRYIGCSNHDTVYDIEDGLWKEKLDAPPIGVCSFSLNAAYVRVMEIDPTYRRA